MYSYVTLHSQACPMAEFVDSMGHWDLEKLRAALSEVYVQRISALMTPSMCFGSDVVGLSRFVYLLVESATMQGDSGCGALWSQIREQCDHWKALPLGWLKISVDGAVDTASGAAAVGVFSVR
ncbi:hypothetical protein V6N13_137213 [Hibiscus sabdariffa]